MHVCQCINETNSLRFFLHCLRLPLHLQQQNELIWRKNESVKRLLLFEWFLKDHISFIFVRRCFENPLRMENNSIKVIIFNVCNLLLLIESDRWQRKGYTHAHTHTVKKDMCSVSIDIVCASTPMLFAWKRHFLMFYLLCDVFAHVSNSLFVVICSYSLWCLYRR